MENNFLKGAKNAMGKLTGRNEQGQACNENDMSIANHAVEAAKANASNEEQAQLNEFQQQMDRNHTKG
ncbi:hypothetical protein N781_15230 [Pontibacillus halophilus JSM 076056 = DSM 19796]|uniref:Uncharacterized protein n=1 Tax=Pontibacillus halophilus JSM 076056 = DSM 19796 TaxID=1385510 RepID=A0A0A5GN48_9BACI|nr:DUF3813 family protein [Pontibacillus halophilus]KGX92668.1 hypothetical protein N781_15230 [Pontibacillus halophilus JSM 076056 = DSM 19796]